MKGLLFLFCIAALFASNLFADDSSGDLYYFHTGLKPGDQELYKEMEAPFPEYYRFFADPAYPQNCDEMVNDEQKRVRMWQKSPMRNDRVIFKSWYLWCWGMVQYAESSIPEQNFLGPTPIDTKIMQELHAWFSQKI